MVEVEVLHPLLGLNLHSGNGFQRFNTANTKTHSWTWSKASSFHLPSSQPKIDHSVILSLSWYSKWPYSKRFFCQNSVCVPCLPYPTYMHSPL